MHDKAIQKIVDGSFLRYIDQRVDNSIQKFAQGSLRLSLDAGFNRLKTQLDSRMDKRYGEVTEDLLKLIEPKFEEVIRRGRHEFATVQELDSGMRKIKEEAGDKVEKTTRTMVSELLTMIEPKL